MSDVQVKPLALIYGPFSTVPSIILSNDIQKPVGSSQNYPILYPKIQKQTEGKYHIDLSLTLKYSF